MKLIESTQKKTKINLNLTLKKVVKPQRNREIGEDKSTK